MSLVSQHVCYLKKYCREFKIAEKSVDVEVYL